MHDVHSALRARSRARQTNHHLRACSSQSTKASRSKSVWSASSLASTHYASNHASIAGACRECTATRGKRKSAKRARARELKMSSATAIFEMCRLKFVRGAIETMALTAVCGLAACESCPLLAAAFVCAALSSLLCIESRWQMISPAPGSILPPI